MTNYYENLIKTHVTKTIQKICETNYTFHFPIVHCGKSLISVFQVYFASIDKNLILSGKICTGLSFYEV